MTGDETVAVSYGVGWSGNDIQELRSLVERKLTARQIGIRMGRSRNSIIGKVRRLGLALAGAWTVPREQRPKTARKPTMPRKPPTSRPSRPPMWNRPADVPIVPVNKGRGITLMQLSHRNCHTVIGSTRPQKGLPRYCGRPAWNDTAYCEDHYAAFHRPPQYRR